MTNRLSILALASWVLLTACSADTGSPAATTSPLTDCSARYLCWNSGYPYDITLMRAESGKCAFRGMVLSEDGLVRDMFQNEAGTWTSTATSLEVCEKAGCYQCQRIDVSSAGARCTGSPSSCSSNSPGSCSSIRGCTMRTRVRYNGTYDNYCDGSPDDCEDMSSESSCRAQGCSWK